MSAHTTFCNRLASLLHDNRNDRFVSRKRTGKLDFKRLSRVAYSDKLFKKKQERKGKNYNLSILVDASGSMAGSRIIAAADAMKKVILASAKVGLNTEIAAFNSCDYILREFSHKEPTTEELNDIRNDLYVLANSSHGEKSRCKLPIRLYRVSLDHSSDYRQHVAASEIELNDYFSGQNITHIELSGHVSDWNADGLAIHNAVQRLLKLKNGGKNILVILSDGQPSYIYTDLCPGRTDDKILSDFSIEHEVARAHKHGITVLSVGIETDSVKNHYPLTHCKSINDVGNELYPAIISLVSRNIKRGE